MMIKYDYGCTFKLVMIAPFSYSSLHL